MEVWPGHTEKAWIMNLKSSSNGEKKQGRTLSEPIELSEIWIINQERVFWYVPKLKLFKYVLLSPTWH